MSHSPKISVFLIQTFLLVLIILAPISQAQQWQTLSKAPTADRIDDIFFVNPSLGWIVANGACDSAGCYGNGIWKTTDGGASWQLQITLSPYLRSVGFMDSLEGWVGTVFDPSQVLYHTTDGGASWSLVTNIPDPKPQGVCGISVVNDSVMYASGRFFGPARVIKTTDRGASWSSFDLSAYAGALVDCYFFSPDSGFVVGSSNGDYSNGYTRILFTSDGGNTWVTRHAGDRLGELCWKIRFLNRNTGFVSIEKFSPGSTYYLKTTDGGLTWNDQLFQEFNYDVQGIGFVNDTLGWLGGWGGDTYETTDGGTSWHLAGFGYILNRFRFLSDELAYASGQTVYKYSFICSAVAGDVNGSGNTPNLTDIVYLVNYVFKGGPAPNPLCQGDANGSKDTPNLADLVYLVNYVFKSGPAPVNSKVCCL